MKKRYLRKFIRFDDSFTGDYLDKKFTGLPFDLLVPVKLFKDDIIPRLHICQYNDENIAKLPTTRSYNILGPGKIKRITLYHKQGFNVEYETILIKLTESLYPQIKDSFIKSNYTFNDSLIKHWVEESF